jgi:hypothetical protein
MVGRYEFSHHAVACPLVWVAGMGERLPGAKVLRDKATPARSRLQLADGLLPVASRELTKIRAAEMKGRRCVYAVLRFG